MPPSEVMRLNAFTSSSVVTVPVDIFLKNSVIFSVLYPIDFAISVKIGTPDSAIIFSDSISTFPFSIAFVNPRVTVSNLCALPPAVSPSILTVSIVFFMSPSITGSNRNTLCCKSLNSNGVSAAATLRALTSSFAFSVLPISGTKTA